MKSNKTHDFSELIDQLIEPQYDFYTIRYQFSTTCLLFPQTTGFNKNLIVQ